MARVFVQGTPASVYVGGTSSASTRNTTTKKDHPEMAAAVDHLFDQHHRIDPLLARGDQAFAALPETREALEVLEALPGALEAAGVARVADIVGTLSIQK